MIGSPNSFGFMAAPAQPQPQTPATTLPLGQTAVQDPQSAYLAQALQSMGSKPQGNVQGLGSNLLADALMQYQLKQRQQPAFVPGGPSSDATQTAYDAGALY